MTPIELSVFVIGTLTEIVIMTRFVEFESEPNRWGSFIAVVMVTSLALVIIGIDSFHLWLALSLAFALSLGIRQIVIDLMRSRAERQDRFRQLRDEAYTLIEQMKR